MHIVCLISVRIKSNLILLIVLIKLQNKREKPLGMNEPTLVS